MELQLLRSHGPLTWGLYPLFLQVSDQAPGKKTQETLLQANCITSHSAPGSWLHPVFWDKGARKTLGPQTELRKGILFMCNLRPVTPQLSYPKNATVWHLVCRRLEELNKIRCIGEHLTGIQVLNKPLQPTIIKYFHSEYHERQPLPSETSQSEARD